MGERRILTIGSQCKKLNHLSFLPKVAEDLYGVMTDPKLGQCASALEGSSLLLDATIQETWDAVEQAFARASNDEATLIITYIGHGVHAQEDFFLLPLSASIPPKAHTAIHLVQLIKDSHREYSNIDGLVILLDTCYSGVAAAGAAARWVSELGGTLRFEVLTAAADRPAADACFSRNIVEVIRSGIELASSDYLRCGEVRTVLKERCPHQAPQLPADNADDGLYLARNVGLAKTGVARAETRALAEIERLTAWFQPTPQLEAAVAKSNDNHCIALLGAAGEGKSALAAALARPEVTEGMVPKDYVQAIAFSSEITTSYELARELSEQLKKSLPGFPQAQEQFKRSLGEEELNKLESLRRDLLGPLRLLADVSIRVVIDGLDRLSESAGTAVLPVLNTLATDSTLSAIKLIVTSRPDTALPSGCKEIKLDRAEDRQIVSYLKRRSVPSKFFDVIASRAQGNWLMATSFAKLVLTNPDANPQTLPVELRDIFDGLLNNAGAEPKNETWRKALRPVLSVLAVAGVGPVLPLKLGCAASQKLGGPDRPSRVRDILVDLRGVVVRGAPGTAHEQVGVFHQTFAEYLLDPAAGQFGIEAQEPHAALAINELAPMTSHNFRDPLHQYATAREAEHLWATGEYERKCSMTVHQPVSVEDLAALRH